MIFGIDVSKWQGDIQWGRVADSGIKFAVCRASIGTVGDPTFATNVAGAEREGLLAGGYHYLYPRNVVSPEKQADKFMAMLGNAIGRLAVVDVEYHGSAGEVDIADVRRFAARWREKWPGHPLIVYTGRWFWVGYMGNPIGSDIGPLWHSRYIATRGLSPSILYGSVPSSWWSQSFGGWDGPTLLQFTSGAKVPGIADLCDADAFLGSLDDLHRLATIPLPESSTEEPVGLRYRLAVTIDTNPLNDVGTASVVGDNHWIIRADDKKAFPVKAGTPLGVTTRAYCVGGTLDEQLGQPKQDGDRTNLLLFNHDSGRGPEVHAILRADTGDTFRELPDPTPYSKDDVTAEVSRATATLSTRIAKAATAIEAAAASLK